MFETPLFGGWRRVWEGDPATRAAGAAADQLAQERNSLPIAIPDSSILREFADSLRSFQALWEAEAVPMEGGELAFYQSYAAHVAELRPLVDVCRWTRWSHLERALAASTSLSDFLTAALVLRTQIDELAVLLGLQAWDRRLKELSQGPRGAVTTEECAQIRALADLLWHRVLPHLQVPRPEEMTAREPDVSPEPPEALRQWRSVLNDYVHPNYGSHEAAARPEDSRVGRVLLEAFSEIYRSFLGLEGLATAQGNVDQVVPEPRIAPEEWEIFVSRTLPEIDARMRARGYPEDWSPGPLSAFEERSRAEAELASTVEAGGPVAHIVQDQTAQLRALCEVLLSTERPASAKGVFSFPVRHPEFGLPFGIAWFHLFPAVRTRAGQLDAMVEDLDSSTLFPSRPPYAPWVRFVRISIELSILLSQLKTEAMRLATVRMLNRGNPLGAVLCARSMLEHYALGLHLGERVLAHWKTIEDTARSNRPLKPAFDALERDVARYLSGTKGTGELSRSWRERWERLEPGQYMGILTPIERAFPGEDFRRFLYEFFSQIIHGAQLTGGDLLEPGAQELVYVVLAKAVAVLVSLEDIDSELNIVAPAHLAMEKLAAIERVVETQEGTDLSSAVRGGVLPGRLKPGRDVFGSGAAEDPYQFRASLDYYEAFERFCEQEKIRVAQRVPWISGGFLGDRVIMIDGREIFFHKGALET